MELRAARSIDASPEVVFGFLESFERHLELIADRVLPLAVEADCSRVRLRGPLGVTRTVVSRLTYAEPPHSIVGRAEAGRRTRARVRWSIGRSDHGSWVEVLARVDRLGLMDRMLLCLGGRVWLARALTEALESLDARVRQSASGKDAAELGVFEG